MSKEVKKDFSKVMLLQSKVNPEVIVLNIPSGTNDAEFFKGVILVAENSVSGNKPLDMSFHYRKDKFDVCTKKELLINIK